MQTSSYSRFCSSDHKNDSSYCPVDTVGLVLRRLRSIRGLSQGDLARLSKANLSYINTIENHPSNLSIRKLLDICNGMEIGGSLVIRLIEQDMHRTVSERPMHQFDANKVTNTSS